MDKSAYLKLENQLCFSLYSASRAVIQQYKPLLEHLDITYPQYLVLLVLWERKKVSVKEITALLFLETNTLTPLLKRMETKGLIRRKRSETDERVMEISLTEKGEMAKEKARDIPEKIVEKFGCFLGSFEEVVAMKKVLDHLNQGLKKR